MNLEPKHNKNVLEFYFHFFCPYSYLAFEFLKRCLKDKNTLIQFFPLACLKSEEVLLLKANYSQARWERLEERASACRKTLIKPKFGRDKVLIMNFAVKQASPEDRLRIVETFFEAVFVKNSVFETSETLDKFLLEKGVVNETWKNWENQVAHSEAILSQDEEKLSSADYFVPVIRFGEDFISGYISQPMLERFFQSLSIWE